jgi:glycerol-3-phosphate dehydrogenase (NAD(P)+)
VHAARGLGPAGETVSEMVREETPIRRIGVLAGPLVPRELEAAMPGAIVVASRYPEVPAAARAALGQEALRVYASDDLAGVELGAALMTVVALTAGVAAGLGGGISTRAVVVARGIAQASRVLEAMGARARTLAGLGGVGEVFVTASGVESPDYELGLSLARGVPFAEARAALGRSAEGPEVARRVAALCARKGVRAPIFDGVAALAEGRRSLGEGVKDLLGGPALAE